MGNERRSDIIDEEIEENDLLDNEEDFLYPDEDWDEEYQYDEDDEPQEREYCD